jgi:hypothetical protein
MKNKNIMIIISGMIFLVLTMQLIVGEVYFWDTVNIDNITQTVDFHGYYQFLDTSSNDIGAGKDTPITFVYHTQNLPLDLTPDGATFGEIDYCNLTTSHTKYNYAPSIFVPFQNGNTAGSLINVTEETTNISFDSGINTGQITINLRDKDSVVVDMRCHYTSVDGLYENNILGGDFKTYMSSYECSQCKDYSFEQLSNMAQRNENITASSVGVYYTIQKVVNFNWQIWLIVSWVIKIGMILVAVGLIFASVYYFYVFFSNIGKEMSQ